MKFRKYVRADLNSTGLLDAEDGVLTRQDIELPWHVWGRLKFWVMRYDGLLHLTPEEKGKHKFKIQKLDQAGLALAKEISSVIGEPVGYYSEGRLGYLTE